MGKIALRGNFSQRQARLRSTAVKTSLHSYDVLPTVGFDVSRYSNKTNISNNKIILSGCINQYKTQNELTTTDGETYELFALTQISKSNDLAFEDIQNSIVDGGNDGGIDSILVIIDDFVPESIEDIEEIKFSRKTNVEILISQCKRENSFKESVIDKLITTLPELFNLSSSEDALLIRFNPTACRAFLQGLNPYL